MAEPLEVHRSLGGAANGVSQGGASARRSKGLLAAGGLLGAILASSCCIVPLALFTLGVGGVWIGSLTALSPYQPIFVAVTLGFLATGYWQVYRNRKPANVDGSACARPASDRLVKVAFWVATVLVAAAVAFPYVAPGLLGV